MPSRRFSPSLWMVLLLVAAILVPTTLAASRGDKTFSTRNAYNDRRAPKPVSSLNVEAADSASVTLDWSRTWDNVGVEGYGVYLDGARKSQTASTDYTFEHLVCGKGYTLGVDAFDDAGNRSRTTSTFASTAACGDVAAPSAPTNVRTVATTETQVILAWSPSTDDFGVVGYGLYVGGFWVGQWSEPSATITNLSCGQTYQIGIDAADAAGNQSARTNAFFSTAPCTDRTPPSTPAGLVGHEVDADIGDARLDGIDRPVRDRRVRALPRRHQGRELEDDEWRGLRPRVRQDLHARRRRVRPVAEPLRRLVPRGRDGTLLDDDASAAEHATPSAPPNLHTTSVTQSSVTLAWDSSTAANGMAGYQIFRDGTKIGEGPGVQGGYTNEWNDTGRTCGTSYEYAVAGVDTKGNVGAKSTLSVSTSACDAPLPPPDETRRRLRRNHAAASDETRRRLRRSTPPPPSSTPPPPSSTKSTGLGSGAAPDDVRDPVVRRAGLGPEQDDGRHDGLPRLPRRHQAR